ncbi:MAG: MBOAT family protein [Oscillospiraceae bacterium]|nr:MBOAT family protein [Oscillospiraceae bacterium]
MAFCSTVFIFFFLPAVFLLYIISPNIKLKNFWLLIASLFFYAFGEPFAVILLILSGIVNYLLGLMMKKEKLKKTSLFLAVFLNIGVLVVFKYTNFFIELINSATGLNIPLTQITLPIGISFFTFQAMSYVIDVYRGSVAPQKSLFKVLLYLAFFPQLVAGPIVKYHDIEFQIENRKMTAEGVSAGIRRFIFGLSKKLLIANTMASVVDRIFALDAGEISISLGWIGAVSYMFQIYFDFSGYSDMAIGLGAMFGFEFKENFNYPYVSTSVKNFWTRWHISVSSWFKEYLYFSLGGNRKGTLKTYRNKLIVFFCTGLWHGANLTFILWGMIHGVVMIIEQKFKLDRTEKFTALRRIYTLIVVCLTFVIFRADSVSYALSYIGKMFSGFTYSSEISAMFINILNPLYITVFSFAVVLSTPVYRVLSKKLCDKNSVAFDIVSYTVSLSLLVLCILNLSASSYNPFIYFRF